MSALWHPQFWKTIDNDSAPGGKVDMYFIDNQRGETMITLAVPHGDKTTAPKVCRAVNRHDDLLAEVESLKKERDRSRAAFAAETETRQNIEAQLEAAENVGRGMASAATTFSGEINDLVNALVAGRDALTALLGAVKNEPAMQKRSFVPLGIQCTDAAKKITAALLKASGSA